MRTTGPARRGLSRALVRAPILAYRCGLGVLLGDRFVLLTHVGRTTGRPRHVVLEVVVVVARPRVPTWSRRATVNRPGSDGDPHDGIPTGGWSVRWAA